MSIKMKINEKEIIYEAIGNLLATGKTLEAYEVLVTTTAAYIGTVLEMGDTNGYTEDTGKPVPTAKHMTEVFAEDVLMGMLSVEEHEKREASDE